METLTAREARRLALRGAALLGPGKKAPPTGSAQRAACHRILRRLGCVQLDTIAVGGARAHALTLTSRRPGLAPKTAEALLRPGAPLFEYWGHETSWIAMELYPLFGFRRKAYKKRHPWWGPVLAENRGKAHAIERRIREEGPLRSADFEHEGARSDWGFTLTKRILHALWSSGELAIRERRRFHRFFDLAERVIPDAVRGERVPARRAVRELLSKALELHGWAERRTLVGTWRLGAHAEEVEAGLRDLERAGRILRAAVTLDGKARTGWVRAADLEDASALAKLPLPEEEGVLLSPFDPILWDRPRVAALFGFEHLLEIYKAESERKYGYYCLPVLAGEGLVARCDLKADRTRRRLRVLSAHFETKPTPATRRAVRSALERYAGSLELELSAPRSLA